MQIKRRFGLEPIESFRKGGKPKTSRLRRNQKRQEKYKSKLDDENLSDRKRARYEKRLNKANDRVAEEQYNAVNWGFNDLKKKGAYIEIPIRDTLNDTYETQMPDFSIDQDGSISRGILDGEMRRDELAKERERLRQEEERRRIEEQKRKAIAEQKRKAEVEKRKLEEERVQTGGQKYTDKERDEFWRRLKDVNEYQTRERAGQVAREIGVENYSPYGYDPNQPQLKQWTDADQAHSDRVQAQQAHDDMLYKNQHLWKPFDQAYVRREDVPLQYDRQKENTIAAAEAGALMGAMGTPYGKVRVTPNGQPLINGPVAGAQKALGPATYSTRVVPMGNGLNSAGRVVNVIKPSHGTIPMMPSNVTSTGQYIIGFNRGGKIKKRFF